MSDQMTDEQKRIRIMEACGWKFEVKNGSVTTLFSLDYGVRCKCGNSSLVYSDRDSEPEQKRKVEKFISGMGRRYLESLDAMAEARASMPKHRQMGYMTYLNEILDRDRRKAQGFSNFSTPYQLIDATAAQHAEAFLRTIEESK